jgi:UDP-N-acetylmuramoyl-L-alanyl-D-glutamate--2,6-diaminopimelate ligase
MTIDQLLRAVRPIVAFDDRALSVGHDALQRTCTGVTHDSRRVTPGTVFVALRGLKMDGADFAQQAIAAGAAAIVSERAAEGTADVPWITVADARLALAHLAAEVNGHPSR